MNDSGVLSAFATTLAVGGGMACIVAADARLPGLACLFAAVGGIALVRVAAGAAGSWSSLLVVFTLFHLVYGLAGPAGVLVGGELPDVFTTPYATSEFLFQFGIATTGLVAGILLANALLPAAPAEPSTLPVSPRSMLVVAVVGAAAASVMEAVNAVRAGGLAVLVLGKAEYQSAIADVTLKLPSYELALLSVALLGLARASARRSGADPNRGLQLGVIAGLMPLLIVSLFLGRRSPLLAWVFGYGLCVRHYRPVQRVSVGLVVSLISVYLAMSLIFANRAALSTSAITGDWSYTAKSLGDGERLTESINPASNEFGAAFGNFSEVVHWGASPPLMGESYLNGLALPIPRWLYPGTKPQQISFRFRDQYFPELRDQGEIAGTAFSSILEAYLNFRGPGVLIVYALMGFLFIAVERVRSRRRSLWMILSYVYCMPIAIEWHRGEFSIAFTLAVFAVLMGGAVAAAVRFADGILADAVPRPA